jgi:hypothetical protein
MKELNLNEEEKKVIFYLNDCLRISLSKTEAGTLGGAEKILVKAWGKPNMVLHNWGISRRKVAALSSRLNGFNHLVLRFPPVSNALREKALY